MRDVIQVTGIVVGVILGLAQIIGFEIGLLQGYDHSRMGDCRPYFQTRGEYLVPAYFLGCWLSEPLK